MPYQPPPPQICFFLPQILHCGFKKKNAVSIHAPIVKFSLHAAIKHLVPCVEERKSPRFGSYTAHIYKTNIERSL